MTDIVELSHFIKCIVLVNLILIPAREIKIRHLILSLAEIKLETFCCIKIV